MADSVLTQIRKALMYQLGQIKTTNGYLNTILHVYDEKTSIEQMKEFPSIVVALKEDVTNEAEQQTFNVLTKHALFNVYAFIEDVNDLPLTRETVIQDIESRLGNYNSLPPSSAGGCTALLTSVIKSVPFGTERSKPNGGVEMQLDIKYRQLRNDPTRKE
jgi:hypothetical protein